MGLGKRIEIKKQLTGVEASYNLILDDLLGSTYALNENEYREVLFKGNPEKLKAERDNITLF